MKYVLLFIALPGLLSNDLLLAQQKWHYPVIPGDEKWNTLTAEERFEVQQIPENILKNMSTREVLQAWLDLPGCWDVLAFDTFQEGFDQTISFYNVLRELISRKDAGTIALKAYLKSDPSMKNLLDDKKGKYITDVGFQELLLSQKAVLNTMSKLEKQKLMQSLMDRQEIKLNLKEGDYDPFWLDTGLVCMVRVLASDQKDQNSTFSSRTYQTIIRDAEFRYTSKEHCYQIYREVVNMGKAYLKH